MPVSVALCGLYYTLINCPFFEVNVSAAIPAAHHARPAEARASGEVVQGAAILTAYLAWHGPTLATSARYDVNRNAKTRGLTPFLGLEEVLRVVSSRFQG